MRVSRTTAAVVAALAAVSLAGCTSDGTTTAEPTATASAAPVAASAAPLSRPLDLVGAWKLEGTSAPDDTVVTFYLATSRPTQVRGNRWATLGLHSACGNAYGDWKVNPEGLFVANTSGVVGDCAAESAAEGGWLSTVSGYRTDGVDVQLVGRDGAVVARLAPSAVPSSWPTPDAPDRGRLAASSRPAVALPAGVRPAGAADLVGRWVSATAPAPTPTDSSWLEVAADGTWRGTNGCAERSGVWVVRAEGSLVAVSPGVTPELGCRTKPGGDVRWSLVQASRAGVEGANLVLFDVNGETVATLRRA